MVCLVVDLEGDGLRLGNRNYPVPFDVDGDGLRERVQWTVEEQREGFLWLDADHDEAMQSDELSVAAWPRRKDHRGRRDGGRSPTSMR